MPRINVYLTDETYEIWKELDNGSAWVQEQLYLKAEADSGN